MEDGANSFYYINVFTHLKRGQGICTIIILTKSCVFSDCLKYIFLKQPLKHEDGQKFVPWARIFAHWNMPTNIVLPDGLVAQKINIDHKYEVRVRKRSNPNEIIWMSLESALPLMFQVLFPYGTVPLIPGKTLRKKAQNLLLSWDSVRCTGVGCQLILFLFDNITRCEYDYCSFQRQRMIFLNDGDRSFIPVPRPEDPSFALYWKNKEAEIQAMSFHFGYPDAMLTLTFNNKWEDMIEKSKLIGSNLFGNNRPLDICYMPFDIMKTWDSHYKKLAAKKFKPICEYLGLGKVVHYVSRLEFQLRGAPHAHVLLWLEKPMSINQIEELLSAHIPDIEISPILNQYVKGKMIHSCVPTRCFKNPQHPYCKCGFPKPLCEETFLDSNGQYHLKRSEEEKRVVEYHPLLLLL